MNQNYLNELFYWITEREDIRKKKEAGQSKPWTTDAVLSQYRFCNVHREDDTVTKWIMDEWLSPVAVEDLPFNAAVGRMINWPDTLEELGNVRGQWYPQLFVDVLRTRKDRGQKVWTGAYMVTGGYSAGGESKEVIIARVLSGLWDQLKNNPLVPGEKLASMSNKLTVPGIGTFLSAQIVADLKNTEPFRNAPDWGTWCAPGPGSTMGLNFLHDRDRRASLSAGQFLTEVNEVRHLIEREVGIHLCAQNTQNCLCELSKYIRSKYFNERLKTTYRPA